MLRTIWYSVCLPTCGVWILIYLLVGWLPARDEFSIKRQIFYAIFWMFLPGAERLFNKINEMTRPVVKYIDKKVGKSAKKRKR